MPRSLFILLGFMLFAHAVLAGEGPVIIDSSHIERRGFNSGILKEYAADEDFNYGDIAVNTSPSLWEQFWSWFWSLSENMYANAMSGSFFKYLMIASGCGAIVFAIFKLAGMDARLIFSGKSREIEVPFTENMENIHLISFDQEINAAAEKKNYPLAVRLMYLKAIKKLNDSGKIAWKPGKTNSEYIREISHEGQKSMFKALTLQFEYIWYGSFPVTDELFSRISTSFNDFYKGRYQ